VEEQSSLSAFRKHSRPQRLVVSVSVLTLPKDTVGMAAKDGSKFGLDPALVGKINWDLANKRIIHNLRSDFVYAPHIGFIYRHASKDLIATLSADLKSGTYSSELPLTIEVPKSARMRVARSKRLSPNFSRPGSILLPRDRLLYQALADQAAAIVDAETDHSRSFSHRLAKPASDAMFEPTRVGWGKLQKSLHSNASKPKIKYIVRLDVANCFGALNQHILINVLKSKGYPDALGSCLERLLLNFAGDHRSRGILQGIYPSDLLGNFYLAPVDRFLADSAIPSSRYVDDIYVFVDTSRSAENVVREIVALLRSYDLVLNEAKSIVMPKSALVTEEPDLEALFEDAVEEISNQLDDKDFDVDYGFQSAWSDEEEGDEEEEEDSTEDLELKATELLFDSISEYAGHEEKIERFCLPLFARSLSDYAVDHVMKVFNRRPAMGQIYCSYLAAFIDTAPVAKFFANAVKDDTLTDWQRMWLVAGLFTGKAPADTVTKSVFDLFKDPTRHEALRAISAIFVGRFGDHTRRKALTTAYSATGSAYLRAAIYFSTRYFPTLERSKAKTAWGSQGYLNQLLTSAMEASPVKSGTS
jgi:Reverse transcriptase (RNA-dependent DNA polymerase)